MAINSQHPYTSTRKYFLEIKTLLKNLKDDINLCEKPTATVARKVYENTLEDIDVTMVQIGTSVKKTTSLEIENGTFSKLANEVYQKWGGSRIDSFGPIVGLNAKQGQRFKTLINGTIDKIYDAIDAGRELKSKSKLSQFMGNLVGNTGVHLGVHLLANVIPGGGLLTAAHSMWEAGNKASYAKDVPILNENMWDNSGSNFPNNSRENKPSQAESIKESKQQSNLLEGEKKIEQNKENKPSQAESIKESKEQFYREPNGKGSSFRSSKTGNYVKPETVAKSLADDPLFKFFNTGAYIAGWTKDVLDTLKGQSKTSTSGGGLLDSVGKQLMGFLPELMGAIVPVLLVGLAAFGGFKLGQFLDKQFHITDKIQGTIGKFEEKQDLGKLSKTATGDAVTKRALELQAKNSTLTTKQAVDLAVKQLGTSAIHSPENAQIKVLKQILSETKKQSDDKKSPPTKGSGSGKSTSRVVYNDVGDSISQLINISILGQPRK